MNKFAKTDPLIDSDGDGDGDEEFSIIETNPEDDRKSDVGVRVRNSLGKQIDIPILVTVILSLLETRIPPLQNLTNGVNSKRQREIQATLRSITRELEKFHNAGPIAEEHIRNILKNCTTGELVRMLQYYFSNSEMPVFEPSKKLCQLAVLNDFVPSLTDKVDNLQIINEMQICCKSMDPNQLILFAIMMQKLRLWITKHVAYRVSSVSKKSSEHVLLEASNFLGKLFSKCLILIPNYLQASMLSKGGIDLREAANLMTINVPIPETIAKNSVDSDSLDNVTLYLAKTRASTIESDENNNTDTKSNSIEPSEERRDSTGTNYTALCSITTDNLKKMKISWVNMENVDSGCKSRIKVPSTGSIRSGSSNRGSMASGQDIRHSIFMLLICSINMEFWHQCTLNVLTKNVKIKRFRRSKLIEKNCSI